MITGKDTLRTSIREHSLLSGMVFQQQKVRHGARIGWLYSKKMPSLLAFKKILKQANTQVRCQPMLCRLLFSY
jgi:hypothetical protein